VTEKQAETASVAPEFLPSEVLIDVPPLTGTMQKTEVEIAAGLITRLCQIDGDKWRAVSPADFLKLKDDDHEFSHMLRTNPFARPDVWKLIELGFARWVGEPGGAVELTTKAFDAMRPRWVITWQARANARGNLLCAIAFDYGSWWWRIVEVMGEVHPSSAFKLEALP
jgi:hypothetical protein